MAVARKQKRIKIVALAICATIFCLVLAGYFFFHPDGHWYRSQFHDGIPRNALRYYYKEQAQNFKDNGKFREGLHLKEWHGGNKEITLGFADENPDIQKYCPECLFTESSYKIGAFGKFDGEDIFWTIDDRGNLVGVKTAR